MKKTYITPAVEVIQVNATAILAASTIKVDENTEVDTSDSNTQLGRDDFSSSSDIWGQEW